MSGHEWWTSNGTHHATRSQAEQEVGSSAALGHQAVVLDKLGREVPPMGREAQP